MSGKVFYIRKDGGFYSAEEDGNLAELGSVDVVVVDGKVYLPAAADRCPACGSEDFIECDVCRILTAVVPEAEEKASRADKRIRLWEARRYRQ